MYQIIAPTLFQNKICRLPGIGTLMMLSHPAENDFVNAQIKAPTESINFIAEQDHEKIFNEFSAISELMQKSLDETGGVLLQGVGNFFKTATGEILFAPVITDPSFSPPVAANIQVRQDASPNMLVGNPETTNVEMNEYFSEKSSLKDRWWIWAILLGAIGVGALAFYLNKYGINAFGNVSY